MTSTPFNWPRLVTEMTCESFGIPTDVTFQIEDNGQLHEVKAHKMILGMVSPTFKTMFYATDVGDKSAQVIKIEKTTAPAFHIMVDAVYHTKSIGDSLKGKSVHEVFDVMILIERYQIAELIEAVKDHLAEYPMSIFSNVRHPITDETVLDVAEEAMEYTRLFKSESRQLVLTCAKFLKAKLKDVNSMINYAAENEDRKEVFSTLLARMKEIIPTECPNCKKEICQDGEVVNEDEFEEGLMVTLNRAVQGWENYDYGTGRVVSVYATKVNVATIQPGITQNGVPGFQFGGRAYSKIYCGKPALLFSCN